MPRYVFKCVRCGHEETVSLAWRHRDLVAIYCRATDCKPAVPGGQCRMERQPTAPNFSVTGFNAKNGYSK